MRQLAQWMGTSSFEVAFTAFGSVIFGIAWFQIIRENWLIFSLCSIFFVVFLETERELSTVMFKISTSSSYYFEKPVKLIPIGLGIYALIAGWVIYRKLPLLYSHSFIQTYLYSLFVSLSIFLFSTATKCVLVGTGIVNFKVSRRGFFGAFQRFIILIRCFLLTYVWSTYFNVNDASFLEMIMKPKSNALLTYVVIKCFVLLWLLWDFVFTVHDFTSNSHVSFRYAEPEDIQNVNECVICLNSLMEPIITPCGHVFCYACFKRWIEAEPSCPICRSHLKESKNIQFSNGNMPLSVLLSSF